jgi:hypothetical protein
MLELLPAATAVISATPTCAKQLAPVAANVIVSRAKA